MILRKINGQLEEVGVCLGGSGGSLPESDFTLSPSSLSLTTESKTQTSSILVISGDGELSISNSDPTICTATLSGTTITVTGLGTGTSTITVIMSGTSQYSGTTRTLEVTCSAVDGSTVTPINDVPTWLKCIWTDKTYTTLSEVIADSQTLLALISDNNAVDYMARSTNFTSNICADALAMLYIGEYNYCADTLLTDSTWQEAICNSEHFELVLTNQVPIMTSNTTPNGIASADSEYQEINAAWKAFDDSISSAWVSNHQTAAGSSSTGWIQYQFESARCIQSLFYRDVSQYNAPVTSYTIKASNDGLTFETLKTGSSLSEYVSLDNNTEYLYYRVELTQQNTSSASAYRPLIQQIILYGRTDVVAPSHTLKTFATATDAEILEMVCRADRGEIDLYDDAGWRVGQEHQISLSAIAASGTYDGVSWSVGESQPAQTATLVLMHKGLYELVNAVASGRTTCSFVVGLKDLCYNAGQMNSSASDNTGWDACPRRNWCNGGFRSAIPSSISSAFKQFKTKTIQKGGSSSTLITSNDYFALAAEKEVLGAKNRGTDIEANALTQFDYYATTSNRIKSGAHGADLDRNSNWWMRTPHSNTNFAAYFTTIESDGEESAHYPNDMYGFSPFGVF